MSKNKDLINAATNNTDTITVEKKVDLTEFSEIINENPTANDRDKGRKLTVPESTFVIDEGTYNGTITDAFWYRTPEDRDRVMLVFLLDDGIEFKNSVDGDWIDKYPFSKLISQAHIEYVENFVGLKVKFDVRNTEGETMTFSNIKKISLDE
ncbi:MAG: hypothetical protein K5979_09950 [Ruminococcus sp.]|nr:hypothetical protein [Ruminococcus sp.]